MEVEPCGKIALSVLREWKVCKHFFMILSYRVMWELKMLTTSDKESMKSALLEDCPASILKGGKLPSFSQMMSCDITLKCFIHKVVAKAFMIKDISKSSSV